ncbi:formylglycine-generating enzyme required for sulfatase activity [Rhizobium leguminosarum]
MGRAMSAVDAYDTGFEGLAWVPGRTFTMGSNKHYPEEAPAHPVKVDGFWIDATPVTNRQFAAFVKATGHVTVAEKTPQAADYPGALPKMLRAGSLVFTQPKTVVGPDITQWWSFKFGADWRHPYGGRSDIRGKLDHPVVHVAYSDVLAYARWAGKDLPTEAEWELAARGGLEDAEFAWGDDLIPNGKLMANTWQGRRAHRPSGRSRRTATVSTT